MPERRLSPAVRVLAGIVGGVVLVTALVFAATKVRSAVGGDRSAWLPALLLLLVLIGATRLLVAVARGSIPDRSDPPARP